MIDCMQFTFIQNLIIDSTKVAKLSTVLGLLQLQRNILSGPAHSPQINKTTELIPQILLPCSTQISLFNVCAQLSHQACFFSHSMITGGSHCKAGKKRYFSFLFSVNRSKVLVAVLMRLQLRLSLTNASTKVLFMISPSTYSHFAPPTFSPWQNNEKVVLKMESSKQISLQILQLKLYEYTT